VFLKEWAASLPCVMGERSRTEKGVMQGRVGAPSTILNQPGVEPGKDRICRISHFEILSVLDAYHFTEGSA
jgi:hypothetical protein